MDSTRVPQFGQASFSRSSPEEVLTTPEHNTGRLTYRPGGYRTSDPIGTAISPSQETARS